MLMEELVASQLLTPSIPCRYAVCNHLPSIDAIGITDTCTIYCFVQAHRHQTCQCGMMFRTQRHCMSTAAGLILQGLPSPLIIRPLAKAEYFEVTLPACINIDQPLERKHLHHVSSKGSHCYYVVAEAASVQPSKHHHESVWLDDR